MNFLSEHPLQHDRANGRMGPVASFQASECITSIVLVLAASNILSKER